MQDLITPGTRDVLCMFLKEIQGPKKLTNHDCVKTLAEILNYLLSVFIHEKEKNFKVLYTILSAS